MFVAEALITLTELDSQLMRLAERMRENIIVQKGTQPLEDVPALTKRYEQVAEEYAVLSARIGYTNATALVGGKPMCALLTERDYLRSKETHLNNVASAGKVTAGYSEYVYVSNIRVKDLREGAAGCLKKRKQLELEIQRANWTVELAELPRIPASENAGGREPSSSTGSTVEA